MDTAGERRIGILQRCQKNPMDSHLRRSPDSHLGNKSSSGSQRYGRCALSTVLPNCWHSAVGRRREESSTEETRSERETHREGRKTHAEAKTPTGNPRSLRFADTKYCYFYSSSQSRLYNALPRDSTRSRQSLHSQSTGSLILLLLPERAQ